MIYFIIALIVLIACSVLGYFLLKKKDETKEEFELPTPDQLAELTRRKLMEQQPTWKNDSAY